MRTHRRTLAPLPNTAELDRLGGALLLAAAAVAVPLGLSGLLHRGVESVGAEHSYAGALARAFLHAAAALVGWVGATVLLGMLVVCVVCAVLTHTAAREEGGSPAGVAAFLLAGVAAALGALTLV